MLTPEMLLCTKNLAELIKNTEEYAAVTAASAKYEADEEINLAMTEYSVQQQALAAEFSKAERDDSICSAIQERINEIYTRVVATEVYAEYKEASDAYEKLYAQVVDELNFQLTGKRSCSGDCSACGGCH